jgi:hypothetical protein
MAAVNLIFALLEGARRSQLFMEVYKDYELTGCFDAVEELQTTT